MSRPPYSLKIELVRGCSRRCPFCSSKDMEWSKGSIHDRSGWRFMDVNLFCQVVDDMARWHPKFRMEIDERGEPTFHPHIIDCMKYARARLPQVQIMISTNTDLVHQEGTQFYKKFTLSLLTAGVNHILMDCYDPVSLKRMRELFPEAQDFYEEGTDNPYYYTGPKVKKLFIKDATKRRENAILYYHNQGGNVDPRTGAAWGISIPEQPLPSMCVKPFRELTVHYDGAVPMCCYDWREVAVVGRFPEHNLSGLWGMFDPYRKRLLKKDRNFAPCSRCSVKSGSRVGLETGWFA